MRAISVNKAKVMPRLLPHGVYCLGPAVLCTLGWLGSLSKDGCDYSRVSGSVVAEITNSKDTNIPFLEIGFVAYREPTYNEENDSWSVTNTGPCKTYNSDLEDSYWQAAKAFAFGTLVFGGASAFFFWLSTCFVFSRGTWQFAGYQVLLAFICQLFSFLWFGTSMCNGDGNTCYLFYGSSADIIAAVLWFVAALMVFCKYPEPPPKVEQAARLGRTTPMESTQVASESDLPLDGNARATLPVHPDFQALDHGLDHRLSDAEII